MNDVNLFVGKPNVKGVPNEFVEKFRQEGGSTGPCRGGVAAGWRATGCGSQAGPGNETQSPMAYRPKKWIYSPDPHLRGRVVA